MRGLSVLCVCVRVGLSASNWGGDRGSQQGPMCLSVHNGRDEGPCPSSRCMRQGVITSDYQAGPVASKVRGLGARY